MLVLLEDIIGKELIAINLTLRFILEEKLVVVELEIMIVMEFSEVTKKVRV